MSATGGSGIAGVKVKAPARATHLARVVAQVVAAARADKQEA